jgi:hypothetical protein
MNKLIAIFLMLTTTAVMAGEKIDSGFQARHIAPTGEFIKNAPYPNMWYYRTEVINTTNKPLRIIWFESYFNFDGHWYGSNAFGKTLRSKDFSAWYSDGNLIENGIIKPGEKAVCDVNWHGSETPEFIPTKWGFIAVDDSGNDYYAEATVDVKITKYVNQGLTRRSSGTQQKRGAP